MKLGKLELTKKKLIIGGSVVLAAGLISAGVIFACNVNKPAEVKPEETAVMQEATTEENNDQNQAENQNQNNEVKDDNAKNKGKKENVKDNKATKNNDKKPVMPEVKTDLKVNGDEVVLNAESKVGSSKMILTFNGDKLSKVVLEESCSDGNAMKELKEGHEKSGSKILEFNGKTLKVEMNSKFVEMMNQAGSKQEIIDGLKQTLDMLKGC